MTSSLSSIGAASDVIIAYASNFLIFSTDKPAIAPNARLIEVSTQLQEALSIPEAKAKLLSKSYLYDAVAFANEFMMGNVPTPIAEGHINQALCALDCFDVPELHKEVDAFYVDQVSKKFAEDNSFPREKKLEIYDLWHLAQAYHLEDAQKACEFIISLLLLESQESTLADLSGKKIELKGLYFNYNLNNKDFFEIVLQHRVESPGLLENNLLPLSGDLPEEKSVFERKLQTIFAAQPQIQSITISGAEDATIEMFQGCLPGLRHMHFLGCSQGFTDLGLKGLSRFPSLTHLAIDFAFSITDNGIQSLSSLPLQSCRFGWCSRITPKGLNSLPSSICELALDTLSLTSLPTQLKKIQKLELRHFSVKVLPQITSFTELKNLKLYDIQDLNNERMVDLKGLKLQHLALKCDVATPQILQVMADNLQTEYVRLTFENSNRLIHIAGYGNLHVLHIREKYKKNINDHTFKELLQVRPNLNVLWFEPLKGPFTLIAPNPIPP